MFSIWILVDDNPRSEPLSDHVRSLVCRLCGGTVDWPSFSRPRLLDALGVLLNVYQELIPRLGPLPISWLGLKARVDEGGPANADHSSLERLPADLQAAKDREDYLVSTDLYAALEAEWDAVLARVKSLEEYISSFVTPHEGKEATAEIELQDVAANISLLDLLQGGGRDRDRDGCVKRHRERM
ncbi:hypothetical protein HID58_042917 [Brassica napus]|uniref:Uncharacterized protein n=1 Tax=Brassica napus TaxID=3708 RepID=A0ABQ8BF06_BRANA|nr:hypothetical protein HID58_042917 [Brassica napus]